MMIDSITQPNSKLITNENGKFYAGMTADEATRNGTYRMLLRRDFKNIDMNRDGVLSVDEIIAERERSAANNKGWALLVLAAGIIDGVAEAYRSWGLALLDGIISGIFISLFLGEAKRTEEGTKRIKDMLANNEYDAQNINKE